MASWPIFGQKLAIMANFLYNMDFKFVLPIIHINIKVQTKLEVNWTQINHFIL